MQVLRRQHAAAGSELEEACSVIAREAAASTPVVNIDD
jgi:hypothetical protein